MEQLKKISPAFYGIIIICFFFPFASLTCNGQEVMSLTGFQLITGTELKQNNMFNQQNMFDQQPSNQNQNIEAQPLALFALFAAILGLAISFIKRKTTAFINMIISVLSCIFLLLLKINIDSDVASKGEGITQVEYQFGYWLASVLFLIAAISYWAMFKEKKKETVVIENPIPPPAGT